MTAARSSDSEASLATVDALLAEAIGQRDGAGPRDVTAAVLARWAAGDGNAAAARVRLAAAPDPHSVAVEPKVVLSQWLVAALMLLGLGVLFAVAWSQRAREQVPVQDPVRPADVTQPVRDLAQLRELLPQVDHIELEVLSLPDANLPFRVELGGTPVHATKDTTARVLEALATEARVERPAGWDWPNHLHLVLRSGKRIVMAVHPYDRGARQTLGLRGLQGDLSVGGAAVDTIRELLDTATRVARLAHGVVVSVADFVGPNAFPTDLAELRLFGVGNEDLVHLERFARLRVLDCSGLQQTLTSDGLRAVGRCATLQELSLAGMTLPDIDVLRLTPLVRLRRLDLRGVREFTGEGFGHYVNSALRRDGPREVDLGDVPTLTDAGLARIAEWGVRDLQLAGSGGNIGTTGWRALMASPELVRLDLSRWSLDHDRVRDLAARSDLQQLALDDCGLGDADLEVLATTQSPLRKLSLRDLQMSTARGVAAVAEIPTLRELDIRRRLGLPNDMDQEALAKTAFLKPDLVFVVR